MDRRSWLWRRKSSEKSPGETESSAGSVSSHSERFSDDQVFLNQSYHSTEVASKTDLRESEHNDDAMTLSEALAKINAKEELVKQHIKVAEEAVSGWEKAESEVLALRQQVEVLNIKNSTLEDRVVHLDGALKECLRQLRQTREEKDQIAHDALEKKFSETASSVTSIDIEIYHKLETAEKENSDLKLELSSMAEELEIRLIEMELSNQTAEQASKQHLDCVKKVAMLEAECRVLNSALKKANNQSIAHTTLSLTKNDGSKETSSFEREKMDSLVEIDLMDDFLEMERLVALPESSEADEMFKKIQSLENILEERENEIKALRNQLEESESKSVESESKRVESENELKASRNQLKESEAKLAESKNELKALNYRLKGTESKLDERENELKASTNLLEEAQILLAKQENELKTSKSLLQEAVSKLVERENDIKVSRYRFQEVESKLAECENELSTSREQLKYAESKLVEHEIEHKASRYLLKEAETKLVEREKELKASRDRLEDSESMLADQDNELKASRNRTKEAEFKFGERENEVKASRYRLEEAERKLEERENELKASRRQLKEAESVLAKTKRHLEMVESQYKTLEAERGVLLPKIGTLENDVQKERNLLKKTEAKCQQLKDDVSRLQHEVQVIKSANRTEELRFLRVKQDTELAMAGSKFAECQKTISSISQQLKTLATFDDFLLDTNDS